MRALFFRSILRGCLVLGVEGKGSNSARSAIHARRTASVGSRREERPRVRRTNPGGCLATRFPPIRGNFLRRLLQIRLKPNEELPQVGGPDDKHGAQIPIHQSLAGIAPQSAGHFRKPRNRLVDPVVDRNPRSFLQSQVLGLDLAVGQRNGLSGLTSKKRTLI